MICFLPKSQLTLLTHVVNTEMAWHKKNPFLEVSQAQVSKQGRGPCTSNKAFYPKSTSLGALITNTLNKLLASLAPEKEKLSPQYLAYIFKEAANTSQCFPQGYFIQALMSSIWGTGEHSDVCKGMATHKNSHVCKPWWDKRKWKNREEKKCCLRNKLRILWTDSSKYAMWCSSNDTQKDPSLPRKKINAMLRATVRTFSYLVLRCWRPYNAKAWRRSFWFWPGTTLQVKKQKQSRQSSVRPPFWLS